jgi:hypothetical protein
MTAVERSPMRARLERRYGKDEDLSYLPINFFDIVGDLPEVIKSRIAKYYPQVGKQPFSIQEMAIPHSSYPIFAYRIETPTFVKEIYVKFAPIYPHKNEGLVEYDNLRRIDECFQKGRGYGSPKPLEFIPELNALITEGVAGINLRAVLLRDNWIGASSVRRANLKQIIEKCGYWLREFHETIGIELEPFEAKFDKYWMTSWDLLGPCLFGHRTADRVRLAVQQLIDWRPNKMMLPVSPKHGDMALDNILVDSHEINVLDVSYGNRDVIFNDIACFLAGLRTINNLPRHVLFDFGYARELSRVFLSAYGIVDFQHDKTMLQLYSINAVLERFCEHGKTLRLKFGEKLGRVLTARLCRKYSRILSDVVTELS